jgi:hypothetical protein
MMGEVDGGAFEGGCGGLAWFGSLQRIAANDSLSDCVNRWRSALVWARERKHASYAEGGRYTPRSNMAWNKALKRFDAASVSGAAVLGAPPS